MASASGRPSPGATEVLRRHGIDTPWLVKVLAVTAFILATDVLLPLGVAGGVPYVAVIVIAWRPELRQTTLIAVAALATLLTVLGYFLSPSGSVPWIVLTNRCLAIFAIWATTGFGLARIRTLAELNRSRESERFFVRELEHRVKNTLAQVSALAQVSQSDPSDPQEFQARFQERLQAFAAVHDALADRHWEDVDARDLITKVVHHYQAGRDDNQVDLHGLESVIMPSRLASPLAIAVNELVTNAVKHGALRAEEGRVALRGGLKHRADGPWLELTWEERGGAPVAPDPKPGLGVHLLVEGIRNETGGEVHLTFPPEGARCEIAVPLRSPEG